MAAAKKAKSSLKYKLVEIQELNPYRSKKIPKIHLKIQKIFFSGMMDQNVYNLNQTWVSKGPRIYTQYIQAFFPPHPPQNILITKF